jgi:hypothetical protein
MNKCTVNAEIGKVKHVFEYTISCDRMKIRQHVGCPLVSFFMSAKNDRYTQTNRYLDTVGW